MEQVNNKLDVMNYNCSYKADKTSEVFSDVIKRDLELKENTCKMLTELTEENVILVNKTMVEVDKTIVTNLCKKAVSKLANYKVKGYNDFDKATPLFWAIKFNPSSVQKLIDNGHGKDLAMVETLTGMSALMWSVLQNNTAVVNVLLEKVNLHAINKVGISALDLAVAGNFPNMVSILLNHGEKVGCPYFELPLKLAVENMSIEVIDLFHSDQFSYQMRNSINISRKEQLLFLIHLLLLPHYEESSQSAPSTELDNNVDAESEAPSSRYKLSMMLLKRVMEVKGETGQHLLVTAVENRLYKVIPLLVEFGANVNEKLDDTTLMHMASSKCDTSLCRILLEEGAHIKTKDGNGFTPLEVGLLKPEFDWGLLQLFIDYGEDVKEIFKSKISLCELFATKRNVAFMRLLYKNGVCYDEVRNELCHHSTKDYESKNVGKFRRKRILPKLNCKEKLLISAQKMFFKGLKNNKPDLMTKALREGAEPKSCSVAMPYPLHYAVTEGYFKIVSLLLRSGVNPNVLDNNGDSPVKIAFQRFNNLMWMLLLTYGGCYEAGVSELILDIHDKVYPNKKGSPKSSTKVSVPGYTVSKSKVVRLGLLVKSRQWTSEDLTYCLYNEMNNLHKCVRKGDLNGISIVVEKFMTTDRPTDFIEHCGMHLSDDDMVDLVNTEKSGFMNSVDKKGRTLMAVAIEKGHWKIAEKLMELRLSISDTVYPAVLRP